MFLTATGRLAGLPEVLGAWFVILLFSSFTNDCDKDAEDIRMAAEGIVAMLIAAIHSQQLPRL